MHMNFELHILLQTKLRSHINLVVIANQLTLLAANTIFVVCCRDLDSLVR